MKRTFTVLPFEAATAATRVSPTFSTSATRGLVIVVTVGNISAGSFTPRLHLVKPDGTTVALWQASAPMILNGLFTFILGNKILGLATEVANIAVPADVQVELVRNAGSADTTVDVATVF